ncbi:MAG: endonuclease/exonuclease/phosphatase family protein [Verrucomicrobiota bacterium]
MSEHCLAFWNLENLFAPADFPERPEWLQKRMKRDLKGWSEALFERKISQLTDIIIAMNDGAGPDILGVCEVENQFVLDRLAESVNAATTSRSYGVVHKENKRDQRGIDTAFLYDKKIFSSNSKLVFTHFVMRRTGTRDILQATFKSKAGNDLIVMCNHWPSRSGGAERSAGFRATAGETMSFFHESIREHVGKDAPLMALGDFNDEPWDPSMIYNANATREHGDVKRALSAKFYNLSWNYLRTEAKDHRGRSRTLDGSIYHQGNGFLFDQILASRSLLDGNGPFHLLDETAKIEAIPSMVSHRMSEGPIRFGLPKGSATKNVNKDGYSDHFPVSVRISES